MSPSLRLSPPNTSLFAPPSLTLVAALLSVVASGCTGLSFGENRPGADTFLEAGAIAVDPVTDRAFVLQTTRTTTTDPDTGLENTFATKKLYAAHPDQASPQLVADLRDQSDLRILFPGSGILVMAEQQPGNSDRLLLLDRDTFAVKADRIVDARYHGTRMSPSRKYFAVADNKPETSAPIHVLDATTLESVVIPHDGEWLEAMWLHESDTLLAIVFYNQTTPQAYARILSWSFDQRSPLLQTTGADGLWADPGLDLRVDGVSGDLLFSYTWVGIEGQDRYAVFPVRRYDTQDPPPGEQRAFAYELIIADLTTGELTTHANAQGPVGFSPDGATIVSYRYAEDPDGPIRGGEGFPNLRASVLLIDRETQEEQEIPLPYEAGPQYFVTREGNALVIAPSINEGQLMVHDLGTSETTTIEGPNVRLQEFVSRVGHNELWLVDNTRLYRFDFVEDVLETVSLTWRPEHVNILAGRDLLVLDDQDTNRLVFYDPTARRVTRSVELPSGPGPDA